MIGSLQQMQRCATQANSKRIDYADYGKWARVFHSD